MFLSYLRFALRQIRLYKTYTIINLVGLSTGLASCFIILVYVRYQTNFDRYNENLNNVFLIVTNEYSVGWTDPGTPMILGPALRSEIPDFSTVARFDRITSSLQYNDRVFEEKQCSFADPEIFDILTIPLVSGELRAVRRDRDFFIISESLARKYFGTRNPIGETITLKCAGTAYPMTVTAVFRDIPATSTVLPDAIGPLHIAEKFWADRLGNNRTEGPEAWTAPGASTYALLGPQARPAEVEAKLLEFSKRHIDPAAGRSFVLFPLKDVYLHSSAWVNSDFRRGDIAGVYIYSAVAFLLLFIACTNYLMLSLGRASLRTREVGVRKVFGAGRSDLFRQTFIEALVVTLLSLPIALALVELLLQDLTGLLGTTIAAAYFHTWEYLLASVALTILVGLIAGTYVSLYLSKFNPIEILKSRLAAGSRRVTMRRLLMISQMIIFLGLTLASRAVYKQLRLFHTMNMGFDKENLALFYPGSDDFGSTFDIFKSEIEKNPGVLGVSGAMFLPMTESQMVYQLPRKEHPAEKVTIQGLAADRDIVETLGLKMTAGVSFRNRAPGAAKQYCLINETAAKELGLKDPVGEQVGGSTVIGVVGDFNMRSFHNRIGPLQITERTEHIYEIAVRVAPGNIQETTKWIAEMGARFNKGKPLEFESFDDRLGDLYRNERRFARSITYATGLAIFVACLGIFGMSVFVCQQKVKEIGIRKVLGATTRNLYYTLTKEFVGLIFLSSVVAFPLASYLVTRWLEQFAYRVDITVWDILLTLIVDIVVVLATVSYQALKAASVNPVVSLRYE